MIKNNKLLIFVNFLFLFGIFFSSITFNITPGETSAIASVAAVIMIFYMPFRDVLKGILISLFLLFSGLYCYIFVHSNFFEIVKQFFAYLQIILVFYSVRFVDFEKVELAIKTMVAVNLTICFMEFFRIQTDVLQGFLDLLMSRSSATALEDIGRGISGVTSEPSHLALSAFTQAFLLQYCGVKTGHDYSLFCFIYILIMVLLSASGSGVFLLMFFLIPFIFSNIKYFAIGLLSLFCLPLFINVPDQLKVVLSFFNEINTESILGIVYLSGFRLPSVVASYAYSFSDFTVGGVGSWFARILPAYDYIGIDYRVLGHFADTGNWAPTKPNSLFANISLEFGVWGLIFSFIFLVKSLKKIPQLDKIYYPYYSAAIFASFFLSTTGNPEFIVILGLAFTAKLNRHSGRALK